MKNAKPAKRHRFRVPRMPYAEYEERGVIAGALWALTEIRKRQRALAPENPEVAEAFRELADQMEWPIQVKGYTGKLP